MKIQSRNQIPELLTDRGLTGDAAFIGVAEAQFEFSFLDRWRGRAVLIDVWRILDAPGYSGHGEENDEKQEARYQRVLNGSKKYGERCALLRATSEEAAPQFEDGSLDFCYIDADHSLEAARADIALWAPKVRRGGILAGHDYLDGPVHGGSQTYGVKQAVTEFAAEHGLEVFTTKETDWPSWAVIKP